MDARGTGEMQGPSIAFSSANSQILAAVPGGTSYHVVYPAGFMQDSSQGTSDVGYRLMLQYETELTT